jgi:methylthioribulose-1-phosphate dehydratase
MAFANQSVESCFLDLAASLCEVGKNFYCRGWAQGTSGNYSAVLSREPMRLAITASGLDKGALTLPDILEMDENGTVLRGNRKPSAESLLHLSIVREKGAGAVLHTHSVWATILSQRHAPDGFLAIEGYEMLKGLEGVQTHLHRELVPIFENSQDMPELSTKVESTLRARRELHGFLLQGHGLYTWGENLQQARRHVEIFEFLLEVAGRTQAMDSV